MKKRRINISIVTDAIPSLIQILQDYVDQFPIDDTERNAKNVKSDHMSLKTRPRTISDKENVSSKTFKQGGLVVAEFPAPIKETISNKVYSFEVVNGETTAFVRITEYIGNNKKSAFHVPLEGCIPWKDACSNFKFFFN